MKTHKKQAGVTLHELMITLAMISILLSLSLPSYSEFINKRQIAGAADLIGSYFEDVKMQSVKRNAWVTVTYKETADGTAWCFGAQMGRHKKCDCLADAATTQCWLDPDDPNDPNDQPAILSNTSYSSFDNLLSTTNVANDFHMDFDPVRGTLSHAEKVAVQIKHSSEDYLVNIAVSPTGRVSRCTPSGNKLLGFPTCL